MLRVGFLFNHNFPHQVPHAAPYAFELSRRYPDVEVIVACSSRQEMDFAVAIGALYPGHRCTFKMLMVPWYYRLIDPVVSKWSFRRKQLILLHNLDFFRGFDALVSPEVKCADLRKERGLENLIMIRTRHGAGDRDGVFDDRLLTSILCSCRVKNMWTDSTNRDCCKRIASLCRAIPNSRSSWA